MSKVQNLIFTEKKHVCPALGCVVALQTFKDVHCAERFALLAAN